MASAVASNGRIGMPISISEMTSTRWDAAVVGAGHNGLTAAAYLARSGRRVLVLERRDVIGGAATVEEIWPGYRVAPCAYLVGLLHPRVIEDLDLVRHGYSITMTDPQLYVPFPDGNAFVEWRDPDRTVAGLTRWAPGEVAAYRAYQSFWAGIRDKLRPVGADDVWLRVDPPSRAEVESIVGSDPAAVTALFEASQVDDLRRFFSDQRLIDAYSGQGTIGTNASPRDPGTAFVAFHHASGMLGGSRGDWGYVPGGTGTVSFALADAASSFGAVVAAGVPVGRILPGIGVELEGGELVSARVVLSNADPRRTLRLLAGEAPDDFKRRVHGQPQRSATFKVTYAVTRLPEFAATGGSSGGRAMVTVTPGTDALHRSHRAAAAGLLPDAFWSELYSQTSYDPTVAPPGRHVISAFTQFAPYAFEDGTTWDERRGEVAARLTDQIEALAPGFAGSVERVFVDGPPDIEARIGLTGGHIFHGECLPEFMWDRRLPYRTGAPGVYLCGAGTYPGGSVIAVNGRNAALAVLADGA